MPSVDSTVTIETTKKTVILSREEIRKIEDKKNKSMKKYVNDILRKNNSFNSDSK